MDTPIIPVTADDTEQTQPRLTIDPMLLPPDGSAWAFDGKGYVQIVEPWAVEEHIAPPKAAEILGDVESWAAYVRRFADDGYPPFLTWNNRRLFAVLDYHGDMETPDRCQWTAAHPFTLSPEWIAWKGLANGQPRTQKALIEALEDRAEDVVEPSAGELVLLLRKLRATASAQADTELRPDGTTKIVYAQDKRLETDDVELPPTIRIVIPVLRGHREATPDGKFVPVRYALDVRVRVSVQNDATLAFRLSLPNAERVLDAAIEDRVEAARAALGADFTLLRAAD